MLITELVLQHNVFDESHLVVAYRARRAECNQRESNSQPASQLWALTAVKG